MILNMVESYDIIKIRLSECLKYYPWFGYDAEILELNVAAKINRTFLVAIAFNFISQRNTSER